MFNKSLEGISGKVHQMYSLSFKADHNLVRGGYKTYAFHIQGGAVKLDLGAVILFMPVLAYVLTLCEQAVFDATSIFGTNICEWLPATNVAIKGKMINVTLYIHDRATSSGQYYFIPCYLAELKIPASWYLCSLTQLFISIF